MYPTPVGKPERNMHWCHLNRTNQPFCNIKYLDYIIKQFKEGDEETMERQHQRGLEWNSILRKAKNREE